MRIASGRYNAFHFGTASNSDKNNADSNPITKRGERATLLKATVVAGFGFGLRALWQIMDADFIFEHLDRQSDKILKNEPKNPLRKLGVLGLLIGGFVAGMAALYTLVKTPEVMYKGKVNAFVKGKDMDVYVKGNKVEKELYNQMNEKAKNATPEEKKKLKQQYLKLKAAKNQVPDSVKNNKNKKGI